MLFHHFVRIDITEEEEDSGSTYEPSDSGSESIENEDCLVENVSDDELINNSQLEPAVSLENINGSQNTSSSTINYSFNVSGNTGWDDNDVQAELTSNKGNSKKNVCFYCGKEYFKIARHFEMIHEDEPEVKSFLLLEKKSAERREGIAELRKKGNHVFNLKQTKQENSDPGIIKVARCPREKEKQGGGNFAPCRKCKGWYTKNNIRHHIVIAKTAQSLVRVYLQKLAKYKGKFTLMLRKPCVIK